MPRNAMTHEFRLRSLIWKPATRNLLLIPSAHLSIRQSSKTLFSQSTTSSFTCVKRNRSSPKTHAITQKNNLYTDNNLDRLPNAKANNIEGSLRRSFSGALALFLNQSPALYVNFLLHKSDPDFSMVAHLILVIESSALYV